MSTTEDQKRLEALLEALLDSWDRNNTVLVNLLRAVPEGGLEARAVAGSKTIGDGHPFQLFLISATQRTRADGFAT